MLYLIKSKKGVLLMLQKQTQLRLSEYPGLCEKFVPQKHKLRLIKESIDFSYVNNLLSSSYCENNGRPAYQPELMIKILFLKMYYNLSDRDII